MLTELDRSVGLFGSGAFLGPRHLAGSHQPWVLFWVIGKSRPGTADHCFDAFFSHFSFSDILVLLSGSRVGLKHKVELQVELCR